MSGHKQGEVGVIPEDWESIPLGLISAFITKGATPTTYGFNWETDGILFLRSECVSDQGLDLNQSMFISQEANEVLGRSEVHAGDILITITGNVGRVVYLDKSFGSANINQHIARIRIIDANVDDQYVFHFLSQTSTRKYYGSITTGQAYPQISLQQVRDTRVPLPPLHEQRDIAGALSDVDALIRGLEQLIAKKRDLKQAAMQQLLTGKQRLPGFIGGWEVKKLGDVADIDPENLGSNTSPDYSFRYISLEDVDNGALRGCTEQVFRTAPSRARRKLRKGDVLVSTVRPNLKSHLFIRDNVSDTVCSTGFCVVRCKLAYADPAYVYCHLFAGDIERQIESLLTGSNYPAINSGDVKALQMPFPSPTEQSAIATVLSDMDAEIAALEQRRDKTRNLKQGMMQELLTGRIRLV